MRQFAVAIAVVMLAAGGARASVVVTIDKSHQTMSVTADGGASYVWPVSTARAGYTTPNGVYRPERLARSWFSRKYYNSPMPYSIFFHGGYAIHGSYEISRLGGPASHGCVRLHPSNAATLFALVQHEGAGNTRIVVTGGTPATRVVAPRLREPEFMPDRAPSYAPPGRWDYGPYRDYGSYRDYGPYRGDPGVMWGPGRERRSAAHPVFTERPMR